MGKWMARAFYIRDPLALMFNGVSVRYRTVSDMSLTRTHSMLNNPSFMSSSSELLCFELRDAARSLLRPINVRSSSFSGLVLRTRRTISPGDQVQTNLGTLGLLRQEAKLY